MAGLFAEQTGKPSMMRLVFFLWAIGGFVVWALVSLKTWTVQSLPESFAAIVAALAAGKAAQKFAERKT
jgi:hypothetical protein